jgi:Fur family transcriptional regulator, ferric uptake regulator
VAKTADPKLETAALKDKIRDAGLKSTAGRVAVLRLLHEITSPITHAEASAQLVGTGMDHATVYRNLTDLTEAGLAVRTDLGDHVWRFELRRGEADHKIKHPHFLCTDCGTVECLPEEAVTLKATPRAPKAMRKRGVAVQVSGRCDDCDPASR